MRTIKGILLMGDFILAILSLYCGYALRFYSLPKLSNLILHDWLAILFYALVLVFSSFMAELYTNGNHASKTSLTVRIFLSVFSAFVFLSAVYYAIPVVMFGRGVFAISLVIFCQAQLLWHISYKLFMNLPGFALRVLVLGTGPLAQHMGKAIKSMYPDYVLAGYVSCCTEAVHVPGDLIVGNGDGLANTVKNTKADKIVVSLTEQRGAFPLRDVLDCKMSGIEVLDAPSFYERINGKLLIETTKPSWFIYSDGFRVTSAQKLQKRIVDIIFAVIGLLICLPFIPIIALFIKLDSKGSVFFRQVRSGQGEKQFTLYKFRTMIQDAESKTGAVWAQKNDPRVTRIGAIMRKGRIDEIPQLFNVLCGDMSFVGPRPERPEFVGELKKIIPFYSERHSVKPGVTGWAQVRYSYGASVEEAREKLSYDLYYVKNMSLSLDLLIILETIKVVLLGRGGR